MQPERVVCMEVANLVLLLVPGVLVRKQLVVLNTTCDIAYIHIHRKKCRSSLFAFSSSPVLDLQ